jgi:hypothetical protein
MQDARNRASHFRQTRGTAIRTEVWHHGHQEGLVAVAAIFTNAGRPDRFQPGQLSCPGIVGRYYCNARRGQEAKPASRPSNRATVRAGRAARSRSSPAAIRQGRELSCCQLLPPPTAAAAYCCRCCCCFCCCFCWPVGTTLDRGSSSRRVPNQQHLPQRPCESSPTRTPPYGLRTLGPERTWRIVCSFRSVGRRLAAAASNEEEDGLQARWFVRYRLLCPVVVSQ